MSKGDGRAEDVAVRPAFVVHVEAEGLREEEPPRTPRALHPFRHREYRLLVASGSASLLADGLWLVALVWQVIGAGGSPSDLSAVAAASSLGLVMAVLLGGVAADRFPKRAVLIGVEVVRTAVPVLTGILALTGVLQLWQLATLAFVVGAAGGFYYPTWSAVVPVLLPADELLAANGIEGMLRPLAHQAAGPALAGLLVAAFSPQVALVGAGVVYAVALLPLVAMRPVAGARPETGDGRPSVHRQLAEGFTYLFRTGWLFATLAFATLYVLVVMGPIEVLLPFAIRDRVGAGPAALSLVLAAYGMGSAAGALLVASVRLPRRYLTVMLLCWGLGALPLAAFGLSTLLWVMVAASLAVGVTDAAAMVIWGTLLQRRVPAHLLGRVSSLDFFVSLALMPVSMALAGPVGEHVGIPVTFVVAAIVPPVLAVVALLAWRLPRDEIAHPLDRAGAPSGDVGQGGRCWTGH
jgi:MFS family permease